MINDEYILDYTDPFEEQLYNEKCIYLWSVLLSSLQNSYGLDCMGERMEDCDARAAYFNHQRKDRRYVIQAYSVSQLGSDLQAINLKTTLEPESSS